MTLGITQEGRLVRALIPFLLKVEQILAFFRDNRCLGDGIELELDSSLRARMLAAPKPDRSIRLTSKENRNIQGAIHEHFSP
jgi:hypothetical protein